MPATVFYHAAKKTLVEYFKKTSLNGFGLLYYIRRRKYQRIFWFSFIIMGITFAAYVCTTTLISFLTDPTVTALDPQIQSVYNVPFPSVAVCSNNKLSRQAIWEYAENISRRSWNHNLPEYWENKLEYFAGLLNTDSIDFDEALKLHNELEYLLREPFNTLETIELLSPKCNDLILKCFWAGETLNCTEHFHWKAFVDGACCVFNYQYKKPAEQVFYPNATGPGMGLILLLNSSTSDYFYAEENTVGFNIKLFGSQRIPDTSMGEMEEFHVCSGDDVNVKLNLISQHATPNIRTYSVAKRGCYFPYEHKEAAFDRSECLLKCKIRSIASLCNCVPFYSSEKELALKEQCSLAHAECLERYRVSWQTYFPSNADISSHLKDELMDSLKCPDCYPLCSYNRYYYRKTVNSLNYMFRGPSYRQYLGNISHLPAELSLVKIYYPQKSYTRYQKNLLFNWYQILSHIGGVISICMGCSFISGIEIIYFLCYRLMENYIKLKKLKQ